MFASEISRVVDHRIESHHLGERVNVVKRLRKVIC